MHVRRPFCDVSAEVHGQRGAAGIDPEAYKDILIERFGNTNVKDKLGISKEREDASLHCSAIVTRNRTRDRFRRDRQLHRG
jgi:hypothetical protein